MPSQESAEATSKRKGARASSAVVSEVTAVQSSAVGSEVVSKLRAAASKIPVQSPEREESAEAAPQRHGPMATVTPLRCFAFTESKESSAFAVKVNGKALAGSTGLSKVTVYSRRRVAQAAESTAVQPLADFPSEDVHARAARKMTGKDMPPAVRALGRASSANGSM